MAAWPFWTKLVFRKQINKRGRGWIKEENKNSKNIQRRKSYWESICLTRGEQIINYGAPLPWGRTGTPEGSRKWASLSFYRGRGEASTVGASHKTESWEKTPLKGMFTHTQLFTLCLYAMLCWMKMVVVWLYNPRVPHHVIAVVSALLISVVPLGLYNWEAADSRDPTFTPHSPSCLSQSRWQTPPPTPDSSSWSAIYV